jgi:hypothetical protein
VVALVGEAKSADEIDSCWLRIQYFRPFGSTSLPEAAKLGISRLQNHGER